jgi:protein TonB
VQSAKAQGNLLGLLSEEDYPASALRNEEQGTVTVVLAIGTNGRVTGCNVSSSSGSSALDSATCRLFQRRARFTPARDSNGQPTTDSYTQRVTWRLPAD